MIRINLLGQARPKPTRTAAPLESTFQIGMLLLALLIAVAVLGLDWAQSTKRIQQTQQHIDALRQQKAQLDQIKQQVDEFEKQKALLQTRINVIEELQRNRTGGQELLDAVANTVVRADTVWLNTLLRKGNALTLTGTAGSVDAVAEFITQLRRSGYFQEVEIKEAHQNENPTVQLFEFTIDANFAPPRGEAPAVPTPPATVAPRKG
jgi:type IV pilus assembly protein PilN